MNCICIILEKANCNLKHFIVGKETTETKKHIILSIVRGVRKLHLLQVAHRDLKPENVLIITEGGNLKSVKLCDFGVSRDVNPNSVTLVNGTDIYIPPELRTAFENRETVTASPEMLMAADIFAIGKLIYFIWQGQEYTKVIGPHLFQNINLKKGVIEIIKLCLNEPKERIDIHKL